MIRKIKVKAMSVLVSYLLTVVIIFSFIALYELSSPDSWWVDYNSIEPVVNDNIIGSPLILHSVINLKRDVHSLSWKNDLKCGSSKRTVAIYAFNGQDNSEGKIIDTDWIFLVNNKVNPDALPKEPTTCHINAKISVRTPLLKLNKTTEQESPNFNFVW